MITRQNRDTRQYNLELLKSARITEHDTVSHFILAWFGGHGVHAYTIYGDEVAFWNVQGCENDADPAVVQQSINEHIADQYFPG